MADLKTDPTGAWYDTEDHLSVRANLVRKYSIQWAPPTRDWPVLHTIMLKPPKHSGDKWLCVLKATLPDGERVAFHKGSSLMAALANGLQRVYTGRIDWKVETPWQPPRG